jgi:hypothetical protein
MREDKIHLWYGHNLQLEEKIDSTQCKLFKRNIFVCNLSVDNLGIIGFTNGYIGRDIEG